VRELLGGGHVGGVGHGEVRVVVVVVGVVLAPLGVVEVLALVLDLVVDAAVLVVASVLWVVKARGSEDRGAHW
jgi:hypothetical protein